MRVTTSASVTNVLIVHVNIETDTPTRVYVEYRSNATPTLRSRRSHSVATRHELLITRLRPSTTYTYEVVALEEDEREVGRHHGSFATDALPADLQNLEIRMIRGPVSAELLLLDHVMRRDDGTGYFAGYVALDAFAHIVWYARNPHALRPGQKAKRTGDILQLADHSFIYEDGHVLDTDNIIRQIDAFGTELNSSPSICKENQDQGGCHHGMLPPDANGNVVYIGREIIATGDNQLVVGDTIRSWNMTTGSDDQLWRAADFFDPATDISVEEFEQEGEFRPARRPPELVMRCCAEPISLPNWTHVNSIARGSRGDILLSMRYADAIISISDDFSRIEWVLAAGTHNPLPSARSCMLSFADPHDRFYRQHDVHELPNGNLLMFDNGHGRPEAEGGCYSRALELQINDRVARRVFEYSHPIARGPRHPKGLAFSYATGSARRLKNGHTLVDFGIDGVQPNVGTYRIVEADGQADCVAEIEIEAPHKRFQYRVRALDSIAGEHIAPA